MSRITARRSQIARITCCARSVSWAGLLACLIAAPALATDIVQVRIGNHPTFTRVVFEMDAPGGYRVERHSAEDGSQWIAVTLDAGSRARDISSRSIGVESVHIAEAVDKAVAEIRLRRSDLLLKEMILSNPSRVVLDFEHPASAVAKTQASRPERAAAAELVVAKPEPEPDEVIPEPELTREPESAAPVTSRVAKPEPEPEVIPEPEPAIPVTQPAAAPARPQVVAKPEAPEAAAVRDEERRAAIRAAMPGVHKRGPRGEMLPDALARHPADAAADHDSRNAAELAEPAQPEPRTEIARAPKPTVRPAVPQRQEARPEAQPSRVPESAPTSIDNMVIGAIAAAVALVALVAVRIARRRSLPSDLDVTTIAEEAEDAPEATQGDIPNRIPSEGFDMNDSSSDAPQPRTPEENTAAYSLSEVSADTADSETGLFDDDSEEKTMDVEASDLPTDRGEFSAPPPPVAASGDTDVARMIEELASRVGNLESRLDESNDARERLERQVSAQSEELRVQRAAIARTQRALRSLSRSEEDQATEPALRDPAKPSAPV